MGMALAAITLPGSEAKTIPGGLQLPSCPAPEAVKPVAFNEFDQPTSSCQMIMWLHSVGTFCERVVAPTHTVEKYGYDFDLKTCILDRTVGIEMEKPSSSMHVSDEDAFVEVWSLKASTSDILYCPNIPDSFACMASYCLGSSTHTVEQTAVNCADEPISYNVVMQALEKAEKYHKEVGIADRYSEMLEWFH